jgi:hypothetical protein
LNNAVHVGDNTHMGGKTCVNLFQDESVFKQLIFLQFVYYQIVKSKKVFHFVSLVFNKTLINNQLTQKSVSPVSSVSHTRETKQLQYYHLSNNYRLINSNLPSGSNRIMVDGFLISMLCWSTSTT